MITGAFSRIETDIWLYTGIEYAIMEADLVDLV
jgi:hypothetical protein